MKFTKLPIEILEYIYLELDIASLQTLSLSNTILNSVISKQLVSNYIKMWYSSYHIIDDYKKQLLHLQNFKKDKASLITIPTEISDIYLEENYNFQEVPFLDDNSLLDLDILLISLRMLNYFKDIKLKKGDLVSFKTYPILGTLIYDGNVLIKMPNKNGVPIIPNKFNVIDMFPLKYWINHYYGYYVHVDVTQYQDQIKEKLSMLNTSIGTSAIVSSFKSKYGKTYVIMDTNSENLTDSYKKIMESKFRIRKTETDPDDKLSFILELSQ